MNSTYQGHGIEGRYGGLPDAYANQSSSEIVILPIPFDETSTYQKGSDKGPSALIEASRNMELYDIETNSEVFLKGIYTAPAIQSKNSEEMLQLAYSKTKEFLAKNKFVVSLGGEHAVSFAPIKAFGEHFQKITVLQLDAHADLQPSYEGNPWSHASVMARVKELPTVEKIVSVGIRSMSSEELPYLDKDNTFFAHQLSERKTWIDEVLDRLSGPIYLTLDLDVFDSSLMPSTGTPEPGGLFWSETLKLLRRVAQEKNLVGFDIVELLPRPHDPAPDYLAAKLLYKILSYKFYPVKSVL